MFKRILVPTDGSPLSEENARLAVALAQKIDAKIIAFYAKPTYLDSPLGQRALVSPVTPEKFEKIANTEADEILGGIVNFCNEAGVPCEALSLSNDYPSEAIIEAANSCGADLIFMASHGRKGIRSLLIGSETQKVLSQSTIPVLVNR